MATWSARVGVVVVIVVGIVIDLTAIGSAWSCAVGADPTLGRTGPSD